MKFFKSSLVVAMLMALAATLSATLVNEELFLDEAKAAKGLPKPADSHGKTSLRGTSSVFLGPRAVTSSSCDKNPKICRVTATYDSRTHCCHNKCVDVKTDTLNCGKCGVKCKQGEICCNGHVVHIMTDKKHCGSCNNHCKRDGSCTFGMCNYA